MSKQKFSPRAALKVWEELRERLSPHTTRIAYAGSLRRRKLSVGDIEVVFAPTVGANLLDLFAASNVDAELELMLADGTIAKRRNVKGSFAWGPENKLAVHTASGIPIDFFATTEAHWHGYMVCRTGGMQNNIIVATKARERGWKWNPYNGQLTRLARPRDEDGQPEDRQTHPIHSEQELYEFVGMQYLEPWQRE